MISSFKFFTKSFDCVTGIKVFKTCRTESDVVSERDFKNMGRNRLGLFILPRDTPPRPISGW
jgi:hypothetical protein